jgi:nitrate reductase NapD
MADDEYHVASYVVRTHASQGPEVAKRINSMPGLEVHSEQQGKLIVTAEASNVRELADFTANLEQVISVIAVAPVYHEYTDGKERADSMPCEEQ